VTWSRAFLVGTSLGAIVACGGFYPPSKLDGGNGGGGGGGSGVGGGGGATVTPDGGLSYRLACPTLNAKRCELMRSCGVIDDSTDAYRNCVAWLTATWCGPTKWTARVEIGTLRYDALRAQACATDWLTRACSDWATEPTSCQRFLSPGVPLGGRCYDGYQECTEGVCRGGACPRTCAMRGNVGDVCLTAADCQPSLYCRPAAGTALNQCTAFATEGTPCGTGQQCAAGLTCATGVCKRLPMASQPCLIGQCEEGAFCLSASDGGMCETRRDAGESCSDDTQCQASLVCSLATSSCAGATVSSIGATCTAQQQCPSGSTCLLEANAQQGTCGAFKRLNEACSAPTDCQEHLTCGFSDGGRACVPRKPNGSSCATARDCLALSTCAASSCQPLPTLGERCSVTLPCLWGSCFDQGDGGSVCIEPQGPGQRCRTGADCASGRCDQGLCGAACLP